MWGTIHFFRLRTSSYCSSKSIWQEKTKKTKKHRMYSLFTVYSRRHTQQLFMSSRILLLAGFMHETGIQFNRLKFYPSMNQSHLGSSRCYALDMYDICKLSDTLSDRNRARYGHLSQRQVS